MNIIDYFKQLGLLNEKQIEEAKEYAKQYGIRLDEVIYIKDYVNKEVFLREYAKIYKIQFYKNLDIEKIPTILPAKFLKEREIIPISIINNQLNIAIANPFDIETIKDIEFITDLKVNVFLTLPETIKKILEEVLPEESLSLNDNLKMDLEIIDNNTKGNLRVLDLEQLASQPPVIRLVNIILIEAIRKGVTDIHIEPQKEFLQIRFRIDGYLHEYAKLNSKLTQSIISRIKIIAKMNISERRKPQDGAVSIMIDSNEIDLRVNTLPSLYGEKAVIRILDKSRSQIKLDKLGFLDESLEKIKRITQKPYGILFVCGPTGSGKTTTLYSIINYVKTPEKNIVTVEDPVEYKLPGITQVQINEKGGVTFPSALRAILRQDPDIVLIGEIRDKETAEIAIHAALTGHLVLSTIHTNDSISVLSRLEAMGIESNLIADAVIGIIAQRLVRKICPYCAEDKIIDKNALKTFGINSNTDISQKVGKGCNKCSNTKYKGRSVIEEILEIDNEIKEMILLKKNRDKIFRELRKKGFKPMSIVAIEKVLNNTTTIEEVSRVVDFSEIIIENNKIKLKSDNNKNNNMDNFNNTIEHNRIPIDTTENYVSNIQNTNVYLPTIMIVDDSRTIRMMIRPLLESQGYNVIEAENGRIAIEKLKQQKVDFIIMDLMMPELNGFQTLKIIRDHPIWENIPVIMLTTKAELENEMTGFNLGVDEFMPKPFMPERLLARVKAIFKRYKKQT